MSLLSLRGIARLAPAALAAALAATPATLAHDEDGDEHDHHHHHGVVIQPRNFDHAVDLVRDGLKEIGEAVSRGDMHALHELSDGVAVPARALGKLAAARAGAAPANIRAINQLGQDLATLVDAMHVAADSGKSDVVVAKWKEIEGLVPQLDAVSPRLTLGMDFVGAQPSAPDAAFRLWLQRPDGAKVTSFASEPGRGMHMYIVSSDLRFFAHRATDADSEGIFTFRFPSPATREHAVFAVSQPSERAEPLVVRKQEVVLLNSDGSAPAAVTADTEPSKLVDGYLVRVSGLDHLHAGEQAVITYRIDEAKRPGGITTEEMLGGPACVVAISQDTRQLVRPTTVERGDVGEIRVRIVFPREGLFGTWLEFKHGGKVVTVPFVVDVHGDH